MTNRTFELRTPQLLYDVDDMESEWLLENNITGFTYMHNIGYDIKTPLTKVFI